ncbi:MAG: DUF2924 domain-containing protein [Planctomycetaceae bacterium]|nr:DUF2924 domain-containing protein [Planctomycetaceae bacterium]
MKTLNVDRELARLRKTGVKDLCEEYANVFGEPTRSRNKDWLIKRIIWRMQANAFGDLSERAKQRALEIANDADLRLQAPRQPSPRAHQVAVMSPAPGRLPIPGTLLTREYKGKQIDVLVRDRGFEFEGELFRSLSAVAKKITGTHVNGYLFFRLGKYRGAK